MDLPGPLGNPPPSTFQFIGAVQITALMFPSIPPLQAGQRAPAAA